MMNSAAWFFLGTTVGFLLALIITAYVVGEIEHYYDQKDKEE